ncbi:MAG: AAA family ATPase [Anaerolineae bacterium]
MARVEVALFGPLHILVDGRPAGGIYSDKVRALLAYLALEPDRPHRREGLAGLLWPDYPEGNARHSLSQALHTLHRLLDPGSSTRDGQNLISTRQTVLLSGVADFVDAAQFAALLNACETHQHGAIGSCPECLARLRRAVALYSGELLAGFGLGDSPAFEEWLLFEREHYHRLAVEALRALLSSGQPEADLKTPARQWVQLEPLEDEPRRTLMRLLARDGHRTEALAQYERFSSMLEEQMGATPEPATTALYEMLLTSPSRDAPETAGSGAPAPAFLSGPERYLPPLFVARDQELARLEEHLRAAVGGQTQVAFVTGEPGSGKTALLHEFLRRPLAEHPSLVTAVGHCNAHTGVGDPYLAFRELLAQLCGDVETRWAAGAISGEQARRLWHLMPAATEAVAAVGLDLVGTLLPAEPLLTRASALCLESDPTETALHAVATHAALAGEQLQQAALFSQYTAFLQRLARKHPLLLVLEDLQWADAGTVALLFHLGCTLASDRIMLVGTYRPAEVFTGTRLDTEEANGEARHPLAAVVNEFTRRYGRIDVDLNRSDGRRFVDELLNSEPNALGSTFRETLLRRCGGNPLFTVEVVRDLQERGTLTRDATGRWVEASPWDWGSLPARVEGVLAERIGRLPAAHREMLRMACVQGETFEVHPVARMLGREPAEVVRWLSGDLDRGHRLVTAMEAPSLAQGSTGRYRFRHILMQGYLYGSLDAIERAYLHRAAAEGLEAAHAGHTETLAPDLAWHYEEAGVADRAAAYLQQAGARAAQLSSYQEAVAHFRHGLSLLETLPEGHDTRQCELGLLLGLAQALQATVGFSAPESAQAYERLRALSLQMGETPQLVEALLLLSTYHGTRGDYASALAIAAEATAIAAHSEDTALVAVTGAALGYLRVSTGAYRLALEDMAVILELADTRIEDLLDDSTLGYWAVNALSWTSLAHAVLGHTAQGRDCSRRCLALARQIGRTHEICHALSVGCSVFHLSLQEYDTGLKWADEEVRLAVEKSDLSYKAMGNLHRGQALSHLGRPEEGIALMRATIDMARMIGFKAYSPSYMRELAEAYALAGHIPEALQTAEEALVLGLEMNEGFGLPEEYTTRGWLRTLTDPPDEAGAEADFSEAIALARRQEALLSELRAALELGRLWAARGQVSEARELVQDVCARYAEGDEMPLLAEVRAFLGELTNA